jgi:hypothetical protein
MPAIARDEILVRIKNTPVNHLRACQNKAAAFVSYSGHGNGVRAVEHLRLMMAELMVPTVRAQVALSLFNDFEGFKYVQTCSAARIRSSNDARSSHRLGPCGAGGSRPETHARAGGEPVRSRRTHEQ